MRDIGERQRYRTWNQGEAGQQEPKKNRKKKRKQKKSEEEGKWKPRLRRRTGVVCEDWGGGIFDR